MTKFFLLAAVVALVLSFLLYSCASGIYKEANVQQLPPKLYLEQLAQEEEAYLLDIRTGLEYKRNHLDSAQNINYLSFSFSKKVSQLDTTKPVFIYCETAHRSPMVARKLWKKGFTKIIDLQGGHRAMRKYQQSQDDKD